MSQHLPDHLDPWRFTDLGKRISGSYLLASLTRLRECLADPEGEVRFNLEFFHDERHRACVRGVIEATLALQCQRCLEIMAWPVHADVSLTFVESIDEAERLPETLDPILVENGQIILRDLIEDELLLALPQVAMHPIGGCKSRVEEQPLVDDASVHANPFAVLAELKRNDK